MTRLCLGCRELREIVYVDPTDRGYCAECVIALPIGSAVRAMQFLTLTIPFKVVIDEPADELAPAHANYLTAQLRTSSRDEHVDAGAA